MKKHWLSIVVLMLVYCSGQLFGQLPDRAAYLENIVKNKAQYIGNPFSDLEKDLTTKGLPKQQLQVILTADIMKERCTYFHLKIKN